MQQQLTEKQRQLAFLLPVFLVVGWLLLYAIQKTIAVRQRATCLDRLHQLSLALQAYVNDYDGTWPSYRQFVVKDNPFPNAQGCPATPPIPQLDPPLPGNGIPGYAYNGRIGGLYPTHTADFAYPELTIAFLDYTSGIPETISLETSKILEKGWLRHEGGGHYLFCDGHVQWLTGDRIHIPENEFCNHPGNKPSFCLKGRLDNNR